MKKYILLIVMVALAGLAGAGLVRYSQQARAIHSDIAARENSIVGIHAFLQAPAASAYENTAALAGFETVYVAPNSGIDIEPLYQYDAPEGFTIESFSEAWNESGLQLLYEELKKNKHGEEINTLQTVTIHSFETDDRSAEHITTEKKERLNLVFPLFPEGFGFDMFQSQGVIALYGGDTRTTIESMARSLSHEYGHHYTLYYMSADDTDGELDPEYAKIRGLDEDEARLALSNSTSGYYDYTNNHHLYLVEIAADDYVLLMGSPTVRQVVDFKDVADALNGEENPETIRMNEAFNALPQENLTIPPAGDVPGLAEYFYGFIGETPDRAPLDAEPITLNVERRTKSYDLVSGYETFANYLFTWNTPYEDAVYTLVSYNDAYEIYPVKTVQPGENARAVIGTLTSAGETAIRTASDNIAEGTKTFVVIALLPDGNVQFSEPLEMEF